MLSDGENMSMITCKCGHIYREKWRNRYVEHKCPRCKKTVFKPSKMVKKTKVDKRVYFETRLEG
jgi:phage FluMu protein Com